MKKEKKNQKTLKKEEVSKETRKISSELSKYLKKNNLDPTKDYSNDPVHGKKIKALALTLNAERSKVKSAIVEDKEAKKRGSTMKYDYPLVDGKPMNAEEKKKYRSQMRSEAKRASKPGKEKDPSMVDKKKKKVTENPKVTEVNLEDKKKTKKPEAKEEKKSKDKSADKKKKKTKNTREED